MFRRNSAGATDGTAQDPPAEDRPPAEAKKGRPTPKRSEAERNRYQPISSAGRGGPAGRSPGPRTPADKAAGRAERARRMDAMKRGEEWALGPRDRGPARKLARDYVDAHRRPSEYYMYVLLLLLPVSLLSRSTALNTYVFPLVLALIVVIVIDAYFIRRALRRLMAERLPGESTRGLMVYVVLRALQIRRFRMPAPRLRPGDKF